MGDILAYIVWLLLFPIAIGFVVALLSIPCSLVAGAIWKNTASSKIAMIASLVGPVFPILLYFKILYDELTRTNGHQYPPELLLENFAFFGVGLVVIVASSVFFGRRMGFGVLSKARGERALDK